MTSLGRRIGNLEESGLGGGRTDAILSNPRAACAGRCSPGAARVLQPEADRDGGSLDPARHAELSKDVPDVDAHGLLADEQAVADLPVRPALRDEREDLELSL